MADGPYLVERTLSLLVMFLLGCLVGYGARRLTRRGKPAPRPMPADELDTAPALAPEAQDLRAIRGIGPKLEATLKAGGVTSVRQIAGWSETEALQVDRDFGLNGRVQREDWVGQARALEGQG